MSVYLCICTCSVVQKTCFFVHSSPSPIIGGSFVGYTTPLLHKYSCLIHPANNDVYIFAFGLPYKIIRIVIPSHNFKLRALSAVIPEQSIKILYYRV